MATAFALAPWMFLQSTPPATPWWSSTGTQALILVAALGILLIVHFLKTRELRLRLAESKKDVQERSSELEKAQESLQHLCLTDPLTGLPNRRYVNVSIPVDAAQALRAYRSFMTGVTNQAPVNADLVLMRVDIDHFKTIAEEHGFAAADQVLIQMRDILQRCTRGSDAVIRLGNASGFLVVARQGSRGEAKVLAERIRKSTEEHSFEIGEGKQIQCTCSLGASAYPFLLTEPAMVGWEKVLAVAEACAETVQKHSPGQWILLLPADALHFEALEEDLPSQIPDLIKDGKLNVFSSLENPGKLDWSV
jgi:diguanylate cyclase (GGDEF)-like protein